MIDPVIEPVVDPTVEPRGLRGAIAAVATGSARRPWTVVALAFVLSSIAVWFVAERFAITTDNGRLIASDVPWRQRSAAFDAAFPRRTDLIAVVVDGTTPDAAERAAGILADRLAARTDLFGFVRRPDGGPFFANNGLLYSGLDALSRTTERMVASQAVIGTLAADPSIRGLMRTLQLALEGVKRGDIGLDTLRPGLVALGKTLDDVAAGRPLPLSWRSMLGGEAPGPRELRRFVVAQPLLDFSALQPGRKATDFIRATATAAGLDAAHGVRVRLTGNVPMADEEFVTLEENAVRNTVVMVVALLAMLGLAVRSSRAIVGIVASLVVGLVVTGAIGLAIYGALNLISVAFAVLFIGLGVDFGIQFAVSYRARSRPGDSGVVAVRRAAFEVGASLALAAVAIAAGFFAFEPTEYRGVSELGVIAGIGMVIAFFAAITVLPAVLRLLRVPPMAAAMGFARLGAVDRWTIAHRRPVLAAAAVVAIASAALLPRVRFDFDPLHLRSPDTEAVATVLDLSRDPQTTPNTIDVLAPSLAAAGPIAKRLAALPEVAQVLTLESFVPSDQDAKLVLIGDAATLLGPTLDPGATQAAPTRDDDSAAMLAAADALRDAAAAAPATPAADAATRVATGLAAAAGPRADRAALEAALLPGLRTTLDQLRDALSAGPVTIDTMPRDLVGDWIAPDGRARIEVYPKHTVAAAGAPPAEAAEAAELRRFIAAVRTIAPDATGAPISIQESATTIVRAFVQAGICALIAISLLLVAVLRRARDVLVTLASLLLGGLVTLAACVVLDIALNYENIIALPLLFGIGVAFNIYFVIAWRHGETHLLQTSIARAVIFSAFTTATAFGSLWLSSHPGTASMGKLLALSLAATLAAALFALPALLGPPRSSTARGASGPSIKIGS